MSAPAVARIYETEPIRLREKVLAARACLIRAMELNEGTDVSEDNEAEAGCLLWVARDTLTELDAALVALVKVTP